MRVTDRQERSDDGNRGTGKVECQCGTGRCRWPPLALPVPGPGGRRTGRPHPRLRRSAAGPGQGSDFPGSPRHPFGGAGQAGRACRRRRLRAGPQPNRLRRAAPAGGQSVAAAVAAACGGHTQAQPACLSEEPLSLPGEALPGRAAEAVAGQRPGAGCQAGAGGVRKSAVPRLRY